MSECLLVSNQVLFTPHEKIPLAIARCFAGNISAINDPPAGLIAASLLTEYIPHRMRVWDKTEILPGGETHPEEEELDVGGGEATDHQTDREHQRGEGQQPRPRDPGDKNHQNMRMKPVLHYLNWGFMWSNSLFNPLMPVVDISTTFILVFYKLLKYLKAPQRLYLFTR